MGKLTVKQIENAKPQVRPYKLMDGQGLQLRVAVDGVKTWLVRFMLDGKERQYRLPETYGTGIGRFGLAEAREAASNIRSLARKNIDIQAKLNREREVELQRQATEIAKSKTLKDLFDAWVQTVARNDEGKELKRSFTRGVFPIAGDLMLGHLQSDHIQKMLTPIVARNSHRMAATLFADLKQMFRWGSGRSDWKNLFDDPTTEVEVKKIFKGYKNTERTRVLSKKEVKELAIKLPAAGLMPQTQIAMWIMLSCCCRIGEIIKARWEHVDLSTGTWLIPESNSKNGAPHTVFLSSFTTRQFEQLKNISASKVWCFPDTTGTTNVCTKSTTKQIRDRQLSGVGRKPMKNRAKNSSALLLMDGDWVPHDLRRTGATLMQELGVSPAIIERVLNHIEPSKLIRTYQRYDYESEKRDAWNRLGDLLTELVTAPTTFLADQNQRQVGG